MPAQNPHSTLPASTRPQREQLRWKGAGPTFRASVVLASTEVGRSRVLEDVVITDAAPLESEFVVDGDELERCAAVRARE